MIYIPLFVVIYLLIGAVFSGVCRGLQCRTVWYVRDSHIAGDDQNGIAMLGWPVFIILNIAFFLFLWAPMLSRWVCRWMQRPDRKWRRGKQQDF